MIANMKMHLSDNTSKFITYPKFVFLCGKTFGESEYYNTNRGIIDKYIHSKTDDAFIVLSEKLWEES